MQRTFTVRNTGERLPSRSPAHCLAIVRHRPLLCGLTSPSPRTPLVAPAGVLQPRLELRAHAAAHAGDGFWTGHQHNSASDGAHGGSPIGSSSSSISGGSKRVGARANPSQTYELTLRPSVMDKAPTLYRNSNSNMDLEAAPLLGLASKLAQQEGSGAPATTGGSGPASYPTPGNMPPLQGWKWLVGLCSLSVVVCYADRSNISTAVLPMAEQFKWDKAFQGVVLSSFFGGYALTQVLGGQLADRFGGKVVLAGGVAIWSFFTLITPELASLGVVPLLAGRVLLGVGEGVAFPSIHSLIARNVPQASQSTAVGVVTAASYVGTALAFGISPMIISSLGWQWVFYLFAGLALLWLPLWYPIRTSDSDSWRWAKRRSDDGEGADSDRETAGLLDGGASSSAAVEGGAGAAQRQQGFRALMRRKEVWAICAAQYCQSWGMYGLLNWLPTFFKDFYHIEIADLGSYTLAPYVVQGGLGLLSGVLADKMLLNGWGVRQVRILLQTVGMLGPAACLMLAVSPAVGASAAFASQLITLGLGFSALTLGGVSASHLDVAPRHAGVIFGAGNTAATLAGLLSVPFTGYLLQSTGSWPLVFGVTAGHYVVGAALWAAWVGDKPLPEDGTGPIMGRSAVH